MKQRRTKGDPRQYFQRKYYFFDVANIGGDKSRRAVDNFREEPKYDHTCKQDNGKIGLAFFSAHIPTRFENNRKYECIHQKQQDWVNKRPRQPDLRTAVSTINITAGHLPNKLAVTPQTSEHGHGRGGMRLMGIIHKSSIYCFSVHAWASTIFKLYSAEL